MSHTDFMIAQKLVRNETPIPALAMAILLRFGNVAWLQLAEIWPEIVGEVYARKNAPGGYLQGELEAMQAESPPDEDAPKGEA